MKQKGFVWNHWTKLNDEKRVRCNYCTKTYAQGVPPKRMQRHLNEACRNAPDDAKSQPEQSFQISATNGIAGSSSNMAQTPKTNCSIDHISEAEQQDLGLSLT